MSIRTHDPLAHLSPHLKSSIRNVEGKKIGSFSLIKCRGRTNLLCIFSVDHMPRRAEYLFPELVITSLFG
ncbi:hypothetical protein N7453_011327 [Penicillium expansum]|nr:hypothetical protein N7453_011327 [Penicillium expansum]